MQKQVPQNPEVISEVARLKEFFETTPILIKEWREGCMVVKDIPKFIQLELNAAATFNPQHPFNPPLKRLLLLEQAVRNQITAPKQSIA
ncbi:hypothetical protein F0919_17740 [Taibaiella lutea]|uniref:DUF6965 domain-containing protein n=1 Tax=Taibaiella lutea TaxID=2608001 RepID=A0A5M6CBU5_9BACT|nr:hypothetical protein [Taibaiella lutea]KAA5532624.1 hypothetical protein F0919_17740 [Taibaiella lutea]